MLWQFPFVGIKIGVHQVNLKVCLMPLSSVHQGGILSSVDYKL
jgi:hypothetical protein